MGLRQGALFEQNEKESLRTREFGDRYSRYFAGGFALRRCRNSIRRYSAASKREFRSQFPLFPLYEEKRPLCLARCDKSIALHAVRDDVPRTGTHLILTRLNHPRPFKWFGATARYPYANCATSANRMPYLRIACRIGRGVMIQSDNLQLVHRLIDYFWYRF